MCGLPEGGGQGDAVMGRSQPGNKTTFHWLLAALREAPARPAESAPGSFAGRERWARPPPRQDGGVAVGASASTSGQRLDAAGRGRRRGRRRSPAMAWRRRAARPASSSPPSTPRPRTTAAPRCSAGGWLPCPDQACTASATSRPTAQPGPQRRRHRDAPRQSVGVPPVPSVLLAGQAWLAQTEAQRQY